MWRFTVLVCFCEKISTHTSVGEVCPYKSFIYYRAPFAYQRQVGHQSQTFQTINGSFSNVFMYAIRLGLGYHLVALRSCWVSNESAMIARVDFYTLVILQIPYGSYWQWWLDDPPRQRQYPVSLLTIGISCIIGNCTSLTHILDISCTAVTRPEKLTGEKKLADLSSALPVDRK